MHVTKTADIHQDVETETIAALEPAQQLIVRPAMTCAQADQFVAPRLRQCRHRAAQLPV